MRNQFGTQKCPIENVEVEMSKKHVQMKIENVANFEMLFKSSIKDLKGKLKWSWYMYSFQN